MVSVQNLAPVCESVRHFHELIELATDRLLVFPRLSYAIKDVVAEWIIPGDDGHSCSPTVLLCCRRVGQRSPPVQDGLQCVLPRPAAWVVCFLGSVGRLAV